MNDQPIRELGPAAPFRFAEQFTPPPAVPVNSVAQTTYEHVYEVAPRLMQQHVLQQTFPNWDTLRIMNARHQHLEWMHRHFATVVVHGSALWDDLESSVGRIREPEV